MSCYGFLTKSSPVYFGGFVELLALSDDSKLFLIMCTIYENVWHHKMSSLFQVSRVFIALRPMGFRPLDHPVAGYRTFNWPRIASLPNAKLALAGVGICPLGFLSRFISVAQPQRLALSFRCH